jgi:hypothetical protein
MLSFVPYTFDLYASLPRYARDSAARMVSFARRDGVCWFSVRTFARIARLSKSTASRHLALLSRPALGFATRCWDAEEGGYLYTISQRFLPRGAVSHGRAPGVPRAGTKNKVVKNKGKFAFERDADLPDESAKWAPRLRWWRRDGSWPVDAGPKPGEAGCRVPPELLAM